MTEQLVGAIRGWRSLGRPSDGQVFCAGCWDRSEHNTAADHRIPAGQDVWWSPLHPEHGDGDAYCTRCVTEDARAYGMLPASPVAASDAPHSHEDTDHAR